MTRPQKTTEQRGGRVSRREFIAGTVAAAAFTIVPRNVLGGNGHTPPSEKLNIAGVGVGGQGASDLLRLPNKNIIALCDVDAQRAGPTFERYPNANNDGTIWDTPYEIFGGTNIDSYPLVNPWGPKCGDVNNDGSVNVADLTYLIDYLFFGGPVPVPYHCTADVNCDGIVDLTDVNLVLLDFGKAAKIAKSEMKSDSNKIVKIRDDLIRGLIEPIPYAFLNGHPSKRLPDNVSVRYNFIEGESILLSLDMEGIFASSGSACTAKTLQPSHALLAMGLKHEEAHGSLMITLSKHTTQKDANYIKELIPGIVNRLRKMSPLTPEELRK